MARTICIANQKGGVGKTTTSVNLSAALCQLGRSVLLIDMDPQGNASSGVGIKRHEFEDSTIYQVLIGERTLSEVLISTPIRNLDIAIANPNLVGAEIELVDMNRREYRLKDALTPLTSRYDYIIIDCPPSLGLLTLNALSAADTFAVPLQCEYYALEGLSQLLNTAGLIKKGLNPQLKIEGIILTMFDSRNNLSHQVVSEISSHFGDKVFKTVIPRNVRLSEAPSHGLSILEYDPKSIGAIRYVELAEELDNRVSLETGKTNRASMNIQSGHNVNIQIEKTKENRIVAASGRAVDSHGQSVDTQVSQGTQSPISSERRDNVER
ncbi:MAG: chromosome partitioning protein [Bdellovibrionales bacterium CG10_big_fil_rev_8_21_14_0_10_45_34]|nr:MAG: chromosome partitioning protein [Bdellovibrionales bacterium CG10_big_fil_rev_8_21_14_0_10_45_34]